MEIFLEVSDFCYTVKPPPFNSHPLVSCRQSKSQVIITWDFDCRQQRIGKWTSNRQPLPPFGHHLYQALDTLSWLIEGDNWLWTSNVSLVARLFQIKVMFLLKIMLISDKPLLRGQPPLSGHWLVPQEWPLNGGSTVETFCDPSLKSWFLNSPLWGGINCCLLNFCHQCFDIAIIFRYLTQGFPVVMFTHLIPFLGGICKASSRQQTLAWLILWTICIYRFVKFLYSQTGIA